MTGFANWKRAVFGVFPLVLAACAASNEPALYGYEANYTLPEPDLVPATPDDKPGRTVDEMLNLDPQSVTVKRAPDTVPAESDKMYEHAGRFGSKEKIALRKGLNAPDARLVYGAQKRKAAEVVRPLALKEREKDELLALSEQELLAEIIAPKTAELEMIEVVAAEKKTPDVDSDILRELTMFSAPVPEKANDESAAGETAPLPPLVEPAFVPERPEAQSSAPASAAEIKPVLTAEQPKAAALKPLVARPVEKSALRFDLPQPEKKKPAFTLKMPETAKPSAPVLTLTPPALVLKKPEAVADEEDDAESSVEVFY